MEAELDTQDRVAELVGAFEALLFASGEPLSFRALKSACMKHYCGRIEAALEATPADEDDHASRELAFDSRVAKLEDDLTVAFERLQEVWGESSGRGFSLSKVGKGWAFRSTARYSALLRSHRAPKPVRLSKAAMEVLAIVAYRQPATRAEVDFVRGVDCASSLRMLLDRGLVRMVGKREEPGRPILYGTSDDFLSLFNLPSLKDLPSLREFHELNEESAESLRSFDGGLPFQASSQPGVVDFDRVDETEIASLDSAIGNLDAKSDAAAGAFGEVGVHIDGLTPDETEKGDPHDG